jgi:hypothetical protein
MEILVLIFGIIIYTRLGKIERWLSAIYELLLSSDRDPQWRKP